MSYPPSNYINNKLDGKKNNSSSNISQNSQNSNYNYVNNSNNNNGSINNNNNNNNIKFWNLDLLDYNMEQDEYFKQFNFQN